MKEKLDEVDQKMKVLNTNHQNSDQILVKKDQEMSMLQLNQQIATLNTNLEENISKNKELTQEILKLNENKEEIDQKMTSLNEQIVKQNKQIELDLIYRKNTERIEHFFLAEQKRRKKFQNDLEAAKGKIRVYARGFLLKKLMIKK